MTNEAATEVKEEIAPSNETENVLATDTASEKAALEPTFLQTSLRETVAIEIDAPDTTRQKAIPVVSKDAEKIE